MVVAISALVGSSANTLLHNSDRITNPFTSNKEENPITSDEKEVDETDEETHNNMNNIDIRVEIKQAARDIEAAEKTLKTLQENYYKLLQKGAQTKSTSARNICAVKARIVKFKSQFQQLKQLKSLKKLAALEVHDANREIEEILDELEEGEFSLDELSLDPDYIQESMDQVQAQISADMDQLGGVLNTDVNTDQAAMPTVEEQQLMNELADGTLDIEDVDFSVNDGEVSDIAEAAAHSTGATSMGGNIGDVGDIGDLDFDIGMSGDDGGFGSPGTPPADG